MSSPSLRVAIVTVHLHLHLHLQMAWVVVVTHGRPLSAAGALWSR
jgi:hypothetical protein